LVATEDLGRDSWPTTAAMRRVTA